MDPSNKASDNYSQQVRQCARRIQESRSAALGGLYDLTAQRLLRLALAITRSQHDAEDALQTTLVRISQNPELLCQAQQPWHYLLQMVRNNALQILRRRKPEAPIRQLDQLTTQCPVDELEMQEQYRAIWSALRKLPAEQSELVVLKIWEEMTFQQIATVLNISPATAASRYRYALQKMAFLLQSHMGQKIHE
ncbi:MAG TPA: sigma-70 family RNA polymerase sigma factor [Planctomycetaceae bacterium]|nr:sigma-70 family RNA polymerase sigma factor [Planctomycetaceae bacterium]